MHHTAKRGISGVLGEGLANVANWTNTDATCLDIKDIDIEVRTLISRRMRSVQSWRAMLEMSTQ